MHPVGRFTRCLRRRPRPARTEGRRSPTASCSRSWAWPPPRSTSSRWGSACASARRICARATLAREDWQLLPATLLRHGLLGSVVHLHSQPPLFNLATGVLLQLPQRHAAVRRRRARWSSARSSWPCAPPGCSSSSASPGRDPRGRRSSSLWPTPPSTSMAAFYFYALPTAALVTATGWAAVRWVRTNRVAPGVAFGVLAAALVLTNSSYQLYTVALATVPVIWVLRAGGAASCGPRRAPRRRRRVVRERRRPVPHRDDVELARDELRARDARARLARGPPTPRPRARALAHRPNPHRSRRSAPTARRRPRPTGHAALDLRFNLNTPNYNNVAYLALSRQYLSDDLHWIEHRPGQYLKNTTIGLRLWLLPTEQYYATDELRRLPARRLHVGLRRGRSSSRPPTRPRCSRSSCRTEAPALASLSITAVAETLLALVVLPIVAWRRRRRDPRRAAGGAVDLGAVRVGVRDDDAPRGRGEQPVPLRARRAAARRGDRRRRLARGPLRPRWRAPRRGGWRTRRSRRGGSRRRRRTARCTGWRARAAGGPG